MSSELVAALVGALVGGLASGLAALGGAVLVEKMKLRKSVRMRIYEELVPRIQSDLIVYRLDGRIEADNPAFPRDLLDRLNQLDHLSVTAGRKVRRLASRIHLRATVHDTLLFGNGDWEDTETGRRWAGDRKELQALFEEIYSAFSGLHIHLRRKIN